MDYKVVFTSESERDLYAATCFLAEKSSKAALRLGEALVAAAESLASFPGRGGLVAGRAGIHKLVQPPHHVILYQVQEDRRTVQILRFWDARQNPADLRLPDTAR